MKTIDELRSQETLPSILADEQGLITYVNQNFQDVFGWRFDEIVGKSLTIIIPPNLHDAHHLGFSRFITTAKPTLLNQPLKLKAVRKDGKIFEAEHVILAEQYENKWIFGATIRPLEEL